MLRGRRFIRDLMMRIATFMDLAPILSNGLTWSEPVPLTDDGPWGGPGGGYGGPGYGGYGGPGYGGGPDILKGVNVKVEKGQVQCIIGPNGAGKSTLLKAISGLIHPRQGEIIFKGYRIDKLRPDQVLAKGICFVPQEAALFPNMSVKENIRMGGYIIRDKELL